MKLEVPIRQIAMKFRFGFFILAVTLAVSGFAAAPQITNTNGNISINVEDMKAGELLRLLDRTTGMHSSIPPALTSRTITIRFDSIPIDKALEKIFENLKFDYVFVTGQGVVVTGATQSASAEPTPTQATPPEIDTETPAETRPRDIPKLQVEPRLPPLIATPFGPIVDRGNPVTYLPPIPTAPPPIPFFTPQLPSPYAAPPWSGPIPENMFRPVLIYQDPRVPPHP
jgi:hypothetical protein